MKTRNPDANCGNCLYNEDPRCEVAACLGSTPQPDSDYGYQYAEVKRDSPACYKHPDFFLPDPNDPAHLIRDFIPQLTELAKQLIEESKASPDAQPAPALTTLERAVVDAAVRSELHLQADGKLDNAWLRERGAHNSAISQAARALIAAKGNDA